MSTYTIQIVNKDSSTVSKEYTASTLNAAVDMAEAEFPNADGLIF